MVLLDGTPNEPAKMNEPCPVAECEQEGAKDSITYAVPFIVAKKDELSVGVPSDEKKATDDASPPQAKEIGLITLSGLPPAHWKNLFHLELVKERNKPTEAPQKPPQAPFFLQWRNGLESGAVDSTEDQANLEGTASHNDGSSRKDGWDAVWSDDEGEAGNTEADIGGGTGEMEPSQEGQSKPTTKRRKVVHHRSKLAELLQNCFDARGAVSAGAEYSNVTTYLSKMGPSSIDVELSSLCYGVHDLEDGLPLLHLASMWLLEACESHQSFEAVNAYLHRFLHVHGSVISRIDKALKEKGESPEGEDDDDPQKLKLKEFIQTISQLREKQRDASNRLQGKMQHSLCLLRHLSRMV